MPLISDIVWDVYTDGSGGTHTGLPRAGIGVHVPRNTDLDLAAPLTGLEKSVQKAEVVAVAYAIARVPHKIHLYVDNKYVLETLQIVIHGGMPSTKNIVFVCSLSVSTVRE